MNCLHNAPSYGAAVFKRASQMFGKNSSYGRSFLAWSGNGYGAFPSAVIGAVNSGFLLPSYRVQRYASKSKKSKKITPSSLQSTAPEAEAADREKDAFFVVRKGNVVGVYRSFRDCQSQVGSSICDPPVSIYKGYMLSKDTEDYLISHGLKNALCTIRAADLTDDVLGLLAPCPIQEPATEKVKDKSEEIPQEKMHDITEWLKKNAELTSRKKKHAELTTSQKKKNAQLTHDTITEATIVHHTCTLEFDGANKGNPGKAGAGAVLRSIDGNLIYKLREGVGNATCNVAEYRAIILGLKYALKRGYTNIRVQGNSNLVYMQVQGLWKVKDETLSKLWEQVKILKERFYSFEISHVLRALNKEADAQARKAISLADGQVECEQVV